MKITYGIMKNLSWLAILAREQGLFRAAGVDIDFRFFPTGRKAVTALRNGWVNMANVIDANIALLAFEKKPGIRLIACTQTKQDDSILARRDAGIEAPEDLAGKKVGYLPRTSSHMFLLRFFEHYSLDINSAELVPISPDIMQKQFLRGELDAFSAWEPYLTETRLIAAQEGIPLQRFENTGFYNFHVMLAVHDKLYRKDPGSIGAVMEVLRQVAEQADNDPESTKKIMADQYNIPGQVFEQMMSKFSLQINEIDDDFWRQVAIQAEWLHGKKLNNYEKLIDILTVDII